MKFITQKGAVELTVSNDVSITDISQSISAQLKNHGAINIEDKDGTIKFKSCCFPFKFSSNPLVAVSSGSIKLINKNNKFTAQYNLILNHLFGYCVMVVAGFLFITHDSNDEFTTSLIASTIIGCVVLCLFMYMIYYGATSVRFNKLLLKASQHAPRS